MQIKLNNRLRGVGLERENSAVTCFGEAPIDDVGTGKKRLRSVKVGIWILPAAQKETRSTNAKPGFTPPGYANCTTVVNSVVLSTQWHVGLWSNRPSLQVLRIR
jgi:hypothetical protein